MTVTIMRDPTGTHTAIIIIVLVVKKVVFFFEVELSLLPDPLLPDPLLEPEPGVGVGTGSVPPVTARVITVS